MVIGEGSRPSSWVVVRAINTEWFVSGWDLGSVVLSVPIMYSCKANRLL